MRRVENVTDMDERKKCVQIFGGDYQKIKHLQDVEVHGKGKGKVHPCTGTEALYRPYGP
jgi:hypothetical protein